MIPARYSASRFPGKLMQDLEGESVILRTYKATLRTKLFSQVYVVTDSEIIAHEIKSNGGQVIISTKEHKSGSDRIAEAIQSVDCDVVVNVQGDEPFTDSESLKKLISVFENDGEKEIDLASLMVHITDSNEIQNPNTVKVIVNQRNFALYFSRYAIPFVREDETKEDANEFHQHIGIYGYTINALEKFQQLKPSKLEINEKLEQLRWLENGGKIKVGTTIYPSFPVDTLEDLISIRKFYASKGHL